MPPLHTFIARVRRRWLAQVLLCNVGLACGLAALPVMAAITVDYAVSPEGGALVLLAGATAAVSLALVAMVFRRMQRRPDDRHVARFIEERAARLPGVASLDDALVSAVDVSERPAAAAPGGFAAMIVTSAVERLRAIDPAHIIPAGALRRAAAQAAAGAALLVLALVLGAPAGTRAIDTARLRLFPESITVDVRPGSTRVPAGTPLRILAVVKDDKGAISRVAPSLTVSASGESRTVRMTPSGEGFEFTFESVDRTFAYRVAAGSAVSSEYTVTALFAPRVRQIDLRYTYPSFTGLPVRSDEDGGDIYAPAGTRVRVRIHTDAPVAEGHLAMGRPGTPPLTLGHAGEQVLEGELVLKADDSYRVALANADGLRSDGDTEYFIRVMDDRPPDVRILRPSADQSITPLEEVSIEARADDDYGIARFDLVYSVGGGKEVVVGFDRVSGTGIQKVGARLLAAEDLGVKPGDVIAYYARARDVGRGARSRETQSDIFFLEVKPFSEEFVQAQSQAGGGAESAQIESLIAAQKEIISATWNIERRAQGGTSAADLKHVAAAQAELRQRVEQLAMRGGRGRGRIRPPAERLAPQLIPQQRPAPADPLASAIEAMAHALQQLEAQKTRDAIPHEMAALNGLLEAQAAVRRREISRQANGGGSGSNRSGQDLSALFDKELQRQQRTNYETRQPLGQRRERPQADDSAADKIRDLARRQEELSRQQRELAEAGLSAEEVKRRLERLTREQMELRERADELHREMSQQARQSGQEQGQQRQQQGQGQSQSQGQGQAGQSQGQRQNRGQQAGRSHRMRDVSEQMRSAAGDLRREDPGAAAQSAERAAERLRRMEREMRGGSAGEQQRATGELQMEAQQVAQEQRRIAAEAERLDKGNASANADARRRLAEEKDRLAARVDEFARAAREHAARDPKGAGASAAGQAAEELKRQQISERMRESARQLRAAGNDSAAPGAPPKAAAQPEQQIARALEGVVEKLGGGAAGDAQRMTAQLEETREMRERLNRLEQEMRDAEAKARAQQGRQGNEAQPAGRGSGGEGRDGELQKLQQEYQRELARAREALGRLGQASPQTGGGETTPEQHEFSQSAPGTEAFKQDRSAWESLRKDVDAAIEKHEASVSQRLKRTLAEDRLSAGGSQGVPDNYRQRIARYYESLTRVKK